MTDHEVNETMDRLVPGAAVLDTSVPKLTWHDRVRALLTLALAGAIIAAIYYGVQSVYDVINAWWPL
jgi:hypothetical protein